MAAIAQRVPQPDQPLRCNRARRGIHRLVVVVRIRRLPPPVTQHLQPRRPRIPIADAVARARLANIEVASCPGRALQHRCGLRSFRNPVRSKFACCQRLDKLELFGEAEHGPRQPPRPRCERRVALLRRRAAKRAARRIENRLMRRAPPQLRCVVMVASLAVIDVVLCRSHAHAQAGGRAS